MPASISTHLDEQEFLELADCYYVAPRRATTENASRTGSTTTISTNNTRLRYRDTTPGPRRIPSTLKESADSGLASEVDEPHQYDIVEGQTFSHIVIDARDPLITPTSISLESYSDDTETFRTTTGHDLGKPSVSSNTLPPRIQMQQIDPTVRLSSSLPTNLPRPISTASLASGSCFGIICIPRWKDVRPRRQKKFQVTQSINLVTRETSGPGAIRSFDSRQLGEEHLIPSRGLASASSLLLGLDYDYQLAVEVLVNRSDVGPA